MATYDTVLSNSDYILRLIVNQSSQDVANNTSSVAWSLRIIKGSGSGKWSFYTKTWSVNIGGQTASGSISGYDFRNYTELILGSGSFTITHNADGTKTISNSGSFSEAQINVGTGTASGSLALTTIPRASTPTFSVSSVDAGVAFTINTNRASTSFTHTVRYAFGTLSGTIATGVATSQGWTPPLSLINEIPSATSGVLTIYLDTYSGSTLIGTKSGTLTLKVPTSIVPDFTTITVAEAVAAVTTVMGSGVYVQNQSKLSLAITGAAGAYGSTIPSTGYKIETPTQTINAQSGTTPSPISTSGTAVVITGTVTDSRGRTKTKTVTINVLPWAPPVLNAPVTFRRALSNGTLNDEGTYIRVDINATVSSLINSTERNTLTYKVYSRTRGSSVWDIINTTTPAGLTFNSYVLISPYSISTAYEVRVEVIDKFGTTAAEGTVATATIFMHWGDGLGLGKYYEAGRGTLDVIGQIYQNDGKAVLDIEDFATTAEVLAGTSTVKVLTPASLSGSGTYRYVQTVKFEASGTFTKASYPWLKAVRVRVQAAGGASGGAPSNPTNQHSSGGGGGGGGYAEKFVLASALAASETVTIGAAGAPGAAGAGGGNAANSSFGTHAVATGGLGGGIAASSGLMIGALGGAGGAGTTGDLLVDGQSGGMGSGYATLGHGGLGGSAVLGGGGRGAYTGAGSGTAQGAPGGQYGGGAGGSSSNSGGAAIAGGAGGPGIILVDLYA